MLALVFHIEKIVSVPVERKAGPWILANPINFEGKRVSRGHGGSAMAGDEITGPRDARGSFSWA